jgi:hypothetical protein
MLVTNQLQYARPADRILYMSDGRVVEAGTYDELMERGGGFAQLMQQTEVRAAGGPGSTVALPSHPGSLCQGRLGLPGCLPRANGSRYICLSLLKTACVLCCTGLLTQAAADRQAHHLQSTQLPSSPTGCQQLLPVCACTRCALCLAQSVCLISRCRRRLQNSRPCSCCTSSATRQAPPAHPLQQPATCPLISLCADLLCHFRGCLHGRVS